MEFLWLVITNHRKNNTLQAVCQEKILCPLDMAGVGAILCLEITNFCWGLRFSVRDATCLPYGEETFDAVEISNALHIMLGAEQTLRKSLRVLKPDGVQVLTTPQGPYGDALMNTAVYHLPAGEERTVLLEEEECALLLIEGAETFFWNGQTAHGERASRFFCGALRAAGLLWFMLIAGQRECGVDGAAFHGVSYKLVRGTKLRV